MDINKNNTTGVTSGAETAILSGALEFVIGFSGVHVVCSCHPITPLHNVMSIAFPRKNILIIGK